MSFHIFRGTPSWSRGQAREKDFGELLKERYPDARAATFNEQMKHIDWVCERGTIDVKAMKRISRSSPIQSELIWIEFKSNNGGKGWLYGSQDWIAFESTDRYFIVSREELAKLCEELCDLNEQVTEAKDALYKSYTRRGKKDVISMVRFDDLFKIHNFTLVKDF